MYCCKSSSLTDWLQKTHNAVNIFDALSAALPDVVTKYEFILDNPMSVALMWGAFDWAFLFFLPGSIAFSTARASAIMSIAAFAAWVLLFVLLHLMSTIGSVYGTHLAMWREAKRVFGLPLP